VSFRGVNVMSEVLRKAEGLDVNEVPDGYIIYQNSRDRVHYLNRTAAIVFELCDGARGKVDVLASVNEMFELKSTADGEIEACIRSLLNEELVLSHTK
jgi:hypothetical protein